MTVNQAGDGLVTGGVLLLLTALAFINPVLAGIGLAAFTLAEIAIAAASCIQAAHRRDNAEALKRAEINSSAEEQDHGRRLEQSGYLDAGAATLLVLGVVGNAFLGFTAAPIFGVLIGVKSIQSFNKSYENGAWSCIKYNLGTAETRARQLDMRATIGALELGIGGVLYGVVSLATFAALWGLGVFCPPALPFIALASVVLGGALTAGAKVLFGRWAARHLGTAGAVSEEAVLETGAKGLRDLDGVDAAMPANHNESAQADHRLNDRGGVSVNGHDLGFVDVAEVVSTAQGVEQTSRRPVTFRDEKADVLAIPALRCGLEMPVYHRGPCEPVRPMRGRNRTSEAFTFADVQVPIGPPKQRTKAGRSRALASRVSVDRTPLTSVPR